MNLSCFIDILKRINLLKKSNQKLEDALHVKMSNANASRLDRSHADHTLPIAEQTLIDWNVNTLMRQLYEFKCIAARSSPSRACSDVC